MKQQQTAYSTYRLQQMLHKPSNFLSSFYLLISLIKVRVTFSSQRLEFLAPMGTNHLHNIMNRQNFTAFLFQFSPDNPITRSPFSIDHQ